MNALKVKNVENQIDQFIEYMRNCYKNRPLNPEGVKTAKKLSWTNTCNIIKDEISKLI